LGNEGLGRGYHPEEIRVITTNEETGAYTYVVDESAVDDSLRPYSCYKELVVEGARRHSLPTEYIAQLECVDPDADRERVNRELLVGTSQPDCKAFYGYEELYECNESYNRYENGSQRRLSFLGPKVRERCATHVMILSRTKVALTAQTSINTA
jgi:hypothetical protein